MSSLHAYTSASDSINTLSLERLSSFYTSLSQPLVCKATWSGYSVATWYHSREITRIKKLAKECESGVYITTTTTTLATTISKETWLTRTLSLAFSWKHAPAPPPIPFWGQRLNPPPRPEYIPSSRNCPRSYWYKINYMPHLPLHKCVNNKKWLLMSMYSTPELAPCRMPCLSVIFFWLGRQIK